MQVGLWIAAGTAAAADYDVGAAQPYLTVGAAVAQATADALPDPVVRIFDAGPYTETVVVTVSMTIRGEGVVPVLRPADADGGVFTVNGAGAAVVIRGVEIDGASAGRAIRVFDGEVLLAGVDVHDTASATGPGGAIVLEVGADRLTVIDSQFARSATLGVYDGGTIGTRGGDVTVRRTTFDGATSGDDGGHIGIGTLSGSDLTVEDCVFRGGVATDNGGALYLRDGDVEIRRTLFETNIAADNGGAFQSEATLSLLVEDAVFVANEALLDGGAVSQLDGAADYVRNLACDNRAGGSGGAFVLAAGSATIENNVFLGNVAAVDGGAAHVRGGLLTFARNSLSENGALGRGHALASEGVGTMITDSYFGHHPTGTEAVVSIPTDGATVSTSAWWTNLGGDWNVETLDGGGNVLGNSLIPPPAGGCDLLLMLPPAGSLLELAASDGGLIGAFGGPNTWPDADGDGWISLQDCDDLVATTFPGATEVRADGVDQDCDLGDVCYADADGDGFGDPGTFAGSFDLDCTDPAEAPDDDESCPGFDDAIDDDLDGVPDDCDICVGFPPDEPDTDGDLVPDGCDVCPLDLLDDIDGDGLCDSADPCPTDPGVCDTGHTATPTSTGETGAPGADTGPGDTGTPADTDADDTDAVLGPDGMTDRGDGAPDPVAGPAGCGCATGTPGATPALLGALALLRRRRRWASRTRR